MNRDIIAIGASAGAVEVLLDVAPSLPKDLPASIFIAIHMPAGGPGLLPELLTGRGPLPASHPLHHDKIERGHIYVAPPDNHLLVRKGAMDVVRGAKENGHRPAADALFRTASIAYGPRVVGVVLSGYRDCGTAGMMSVKARGGISVVQDPDSAAVPEMPRSVLDKVAVGFVVKPNELAALFTRLASSEASPAKTVGEDIETLEGTRRGRPAELVCPLCQGMLTETAPGKFQHFRCHVGHTFTLESLAHEQGEEMDRALWSAVRALEEGAALSRRLRDSSTGEMRRRFAEKAVAQEREANVVRHVLLHGSTTSPEGG